MEDMNALMEQYAPSAAETVQIELSQKTQVLAQELAVKQRKADKLKEELTALNKRINEISFKLLPDLFNEQGLTNLATAEGVSLELTPYFKASIPVDMPPEQRENALAYVRDNAPEIIKTEVSLTFSPMEYEAALEAINALRDIGAEPIIQETVHWSTLTAWVKNEFMEGRELDLDVINAKVGSYIKVSELPREKMDPLDRIRAI